MKKPLIIQGGMGIGVSSVELARAVATKGHLGVVSGTAVWLSVCRKLQEGDLTGEIRWALEQFPCQKTAHEILEKYFIEGGKKPEQAYKQPPMFGLDNTPELNRLGIAAGFVEVLRAKKGHQGVIGLNLLEKLQIANLAPLYGAMLAGVDYVLMGAGIPREIPGVLDRLATHQPVQLSVPLEGARPGIENPKVSLDPQNIGLEIDFLKSIKRPYFFPIVSSATLALNLSKKATGKVDGFIIELPSAGGHNAPPRGPLKLNEKGEPIYGERDQVDFAKFRELGYPFWLAGGYSTPEKLKEALSLGASGVQIGSAFALSEESGVAPNLRTKIYDRILNAQNLEDLVHTDPLASPSGFPFKVFQVEGTVAIKEVYESRKRICDIGILRNAYVDEAGKVGLRCSSEPVDAYVRKHGNIEETKGRKCLCNALMGTIGLGQKRAWGEESPIVTFGSDLDGVFAYLRKVSRVYKAGEFIDYLTSELNLAPETNKGVQL